MLTFMTLRRSFLMGLCLISASAFAHVDLETTHTHATFFSGFLHPLTGLDHLAAMVAVGIWSALAVRHVWLAPMVFVGMMAAGIGLGLQGFDSAMTEPIIAASVLVMGVLVAARHALSVRAALWLVGVFGLCHGAAHGIALQGDTSVAPVLAMLLSTALLHMLGVVVGQRAFAQRVWLQRVSGTAFAVVGAALLSNFA